MVFESGSESVPPRLTEAITPSIASSTTMLPPVLPTISSANSRGTPALISEASVRDQRATATCWTIAPIFIGTRRRKRSHCGRPHEDFFHFRNAERGEPGAAEHGPPVADDGVGHRTETWVIAGSSPPNCLNTPTNTGTRKATKAIITPTAKVITSVG